MISFIYWLSRNYERSHGVKPNVLYINLSHFEHLRQEFSDPDDVEAIRRLLGMNILITPEAMHPHLSNTDKPGLTEDSPARAAR